MRSPLLPEIYTQYKDLLTTHGYDSLLSVAKKEFGQFRTDCHTMKLSGNDAKALHLAAQKYAKSLQVLRNKTLKRANPLLKNIRHLEVQRTAIDSRSYETQFSRRDDAYVTSGAAVSMFSPSAYLSQLYREANALHAEGHDNALRKRRPDLGKLSVSQKNQDQELTTLTLSNEIVSTSLKATLNLESDDALSERMAVPAMSWADLPYHDGKRSPPPPNPLPRGEGEQAK